MLISRVHFMLFASALGLLVGCGASEEGAESQRLGQVGQAASLSTRPPPNGANGMRPSCFWAPGAQHALRSLGKAALDQGLGELQHISLEEVPLGCREVLHSAVQCALTPAQAVRDPATGELYQGWWGLAPSWLGQALDVDGRRYVTACMVQKLNLHGTSVPILLEGSHPAIERHGTYAAQYPIHESTVFGDLFSSTAPLSGLVPAFQAYGCWEDLLPQSDGLLGVPVLSEKRVCDDAPLCGFVALGACALSCQGNGPYWACRPNLLESPWTQTVRVRLEEAPAP